jgi:RNA polymerase sigma factor (sigma-70 family)
VHRDDFERLYEAEAAQLLAFLAYRTGDTQLAEDVLADTFERVLTTRRGFDRRRGAEKTWLYSIALNRLRDLHRRSAAEGRALERIVAGTAAQAPSDEEALGERDALTTALSALSDEEREAIALRYGADLSLKEIASIAGTETTTIKGRIHRGLRKLRSELG